jgi:hypothetical protein
LRRHSIQCQHATQQHTTKHHNVTRHAPQVIYDDGTINDLSALSKVRSIQGPLIVWGTDNASLTSLTGLEGLQVRARVCAAWRACVWTSLLRS